MWANVRPRVVLDVGPDPREAVFLAVGRSILRNVQGVGQHLYLGANGSPETSYGGGSAGPVQGSVTGAANRIASTSVTRDMGGADIATGVTEVSSGASRVFADRLRRGRGVS